MDAMFNTFNDTIKMSLFSKIKTNNPVIDALLSTIVLTFMSYIVKVVYEYNIGAVYGSLFDIDVFDRLTYYTYKKNTILLSGKKCSSIGYFSSVPVISSVFGNRFKAVWQEINNNIDKNPSIYEIKDFLTLTPDRYDDSNGSESGSNDNDGVYIVSQKKAFLFNPELQIFAITSITKEESSGEKDKKNNSKIEDIDITLYSYHTSLAQMKIFVDDLTRKYIDNIELSRNGKRFIYTLINTKYEDNKFECWKETVFDTTRSFDNMFFEGKPDIIKKIDFFINNKDWYYQKGIPYTLGIGLHGPPGTGKTSFIKSLAIKTGRHIKSISFKLLKTRRHLNEFFFENRYCQNNKPNSIGFPQKIVVIEDIDAQGDVVLDRSKKNKSNNNNTVNMVDTVNMVQNLIHNENSRGSYRDTDRGSGSGSYRDTDRGSGSGSGSYCGSGSGSGSGSYRGSGRDRDTGSGSGRDQLMISSVLRPIEDDLITLDDILNLWDGLEENSGRILVISSNHYNDLDPALTRPGRIDITIAMNNASLEIIAEMYKHLYETDVIDMKLLRKVKPLFYSPAEIINLYLMYKNEPNKFMERLGLNKKI